MKTDVTIRPATRDDLEPIAAIGRRLAAQSAFQRDDVANDAMIHDTATLAVTHPGVLTFVAESADGLVGVLIVMLFLHLVSGELWAVQTCWWVDEDARGGVGWALLTAIETELHARGVVALQMLAPAVDARYAICFMRRGYRPSDTVFTRRLPCRS